MQTAFLNTNSAVTEEQLTEWENRSQLLLPEEYRSFLLQTNGASVHPKWNFLYEHPLFVKKQPEWIAFFYNLTEIDEVIENVMHQKQELDSQVFHVEGIGELTIEDGAVEGHYHEGCCLSQMLPIGVTRIQGSRLMIGHQDYNYGKVLLFGGHLTYRDTSYRQITVADSFNEFVSLFTKSGSYKNHVLELASDLNF